MEHENDMATRFADAAFAWMTGTKQKDVSSNELWAGLQEARPDLTAKSDGRKTPRTTLMRDLRKDGRFEVGNRRVALVKKVR